MIEYVGPAFDASGYGQACRGYLRALTDAGAQVVLRALSFEQIQPDLGAEGAWLRSILVKDNGPTGAELRVLHSTPDTWEAIQKGLPPLPTVGYCAWETDAPPAGWAGWINDYVSILMVPSSQNAKAFASAGVTVPIVVMPHAVAPIPPSERPTLPRTGAFRFLSVFQWTERKNPIGLLKAFLTEFRHDENVCLVLKTYLLAGGEQERRQIRQYINEVKRGLWLDAYPEVRIIVEKLSSADLAQLVHDCDAYVSLHRQEGFGLPIVEAMMASKPVIVTETGGPAEFLLPRECYVPFTETPVFGMPWKIYAGSMTWAEPDLMAARRRMRFLFSTPNNIGERCRKTAAVYEPSRIGERFLEAVKGLGK